MDETLMAQARAALRRRRAELESIAASGDEAAATVTLDQARVGRLSRMDALQGQAMAQEARRRRALELRRIGAALQRIDDDVYGWCLRCDEPIARARLQADPAATLCVDCASAREC